MRSASDDARREQEIARRQKRDAREGDAERHHRLASPQQKCRRHDRDQEQKARQLDEARTLRDVDVGRTVVRRESRGPEEQPQPFGYDAHRRQHAIHRCDAEDGERRERGESAERVVGEDDAARGEESEGDGEHPEIERPQRPRAVARERRVGDDGELGGDENRREHDPVLLGETRHGIEQQNPNRRRRTQRSLHPVAKIEGRGGQHRDSDPQLRLADDVGDRFDVHGVYREQRGGDPRGPKRQQTASDEEHEHTPPTRRGRCSRRGRPSDSDRPSTASTRKARMVSGR